MDHKVITKESIHQVLRDYWNEYKRKPVASAIGFLLPAVGTILVFFVPPLVVARIVNVFTVERTLSSTTLITYLALFGGLWFLGEICWRIGAHFLTKVRASGLGNLSKIAFERLESREYAFYANNFVGSLTKKAISFSASFEVFTVTIGFNVITNIFPIIFAVIVLSRYSFWFPVILLSAIAIAILIAIPIIKRRSKYVIARHDAGSKSSGRLSDAVTNMITVKSFAKEKEELASYSTYVDTFSAAWKKAADYQNLRLDVVMSPMYVITNVIGLAASILFAEKLSLPAGTIIVVFSYYSQVTRIFWEINNVYRGIEASITEAAEFAQLFIDPPVVDDIPNAEKFVPKDSSIHFDKVNFHYGSLEDGENSFLNNFNLDIKANQKVGLVGPSGGGKTTITKLLLRFLDLQSGNITIGGEDICKVTQRSLRESIAYVAQEPMLFHRTLHENIAYAHPEATREDVIRVSKLAHAHEFIEQLPHGYETLVGERGIKLSGGQRQRVAIARALLKNAPILVLDEATSALDSESEKYIQEGLWKLMEGKTALVIAHRLSTIKHMDRIIVLDGGAIAQDGTHEELIKQDGLYKKLWQHQSGEFMED